MDAQEVQLEQLIRRLEAERGMARKVRLLVGSWPLLFELSPQERERVALAVGSRWALRNLEGMFGRAGAPSDSQLKVKAIFESLRGADPEQLRKLGKEIKNGGFAGAQSRLLGTLEDALEGKIAAEDDSQRPGPVLIDAAETFEPGTSPTRPAVAPPPPPAWLPASLLEQLDEPDQPDQLDDGDPTQPAAAKAEVAEPGESAEPAVDPERPEVEGTEPTRTMPESSDEEAASAFHARSGEPGEVFGPGGLEPELDEPTELAGVAPPTPEPAEPAATAATPAADTSRHELEPGPAESAAEPARHEETPQEAPADRRRRDATTLSPVESLRALRRLSSGETASSRAGRAALVGSLGSGWAARRAVSSIIRLRSATDLEEALALIRRLPTATQRTWCLGDLLQHWQLDEDARERVLAAAPTEAAKGRLARRAAPAV